MAIFSLNTVSAGESNPLSKYLFGETLIRFWEPGTLLGSAGRITVMPLTAPDMTFLIFKYLAPDRGAGVVVRFL